jgi:hypothetical protein
MRTHVGDRYGKLIAVEDVGKQHWKCRCDCGVETRVLVHNLRHGRTKSCGSAACRGFPRNESAFEAPLSHEGAYWLGMLYTDGALVQNVLVISLQIGDVDHVQRLSDYLGLQRAPQIQKQSTVTFGDRVYNTQAQARIAVHSRKIASDLIALGMHERKTWSITPWDGPEELLPHFWRGCIDGDGGFRCTHDEKGRARIIVDFCGNEPMVRGLNSFVQAATGFSGHISLHTPNGQKPRSAGLRFARVRWTNRVRCEAICRLLRYDDPNATAMPRKRKLAEQIIAIPNVQPTRGITRETLLDLFQKTGSWTGVSRALNIDNTTCSHHTARCGITEDDVKQWRAKPFNYGRLRGLTVDQLEADWQQLGSWKLVAVKYGVATGTVAHRVCWLRNQVKVAGSASTC